MIETIEIGAAFLGSYLLLKRFRAEVATDALARNFESVNRRRWVKRHVGQLNLIVESDDHKGYAGGA